MKDILEILAYAAGAALVLWAVSGFPTIHIAFTVTEQDDEEEE